LINSSMNSTTSGRVYLVGSGPGDPELLTLKAQRLIQNADIIVYDQLPGEQILAGMPKNAQKIDAGKYAGNHTLKQDQINKILIEKAREGKTVVRLKGGDPYVFGRGGEEAQVLVRAGIEVEVVPGITSAIAAPAYAGIPITHRDYASMVTFITGHEDPTKEDSAINWDVLAKFDGTLVILMGVSMLSQNVNELIKHGKKPGTPVALIEKGTRLDQRITVGTLENIVELAKERKVKAPAITVIGNVVQLHDELYEQKNTGLRPTIVIMRPSRYEQDSMQICREAGINVISVPMIEILDKKDEHFDDFVSHVLHGLSDIVIFTSANGIDHTLNKVSDKVGFINALNRCRQVIAIGPMTGDAARLQGINITFIPKFYSSQILVETIRQDVKDKVVDIARSSHGAPILVEELKAAGAKVYETQVYEITRPQINNEQKEMINAILTAKVDAVLFTSSMMVKNFLGLSQELNVRDNVVTALNDGRIIVAAIGPPTASTLEKNDIHTVITSKEYTFRALINEISLALRPQ
jgi:uroporphyrin-III C-methyltransferase